MWCTGGCEKWCSCHGVVEVEDEEDDDVSMVAENRSAPPLWPYSHVCIALSEWSCFSCVGLCAYLCPRTMVMVMVGVHSLHGNDLGPEGGKAIAVALKTNNTLQSIKCAFVFVV